MIYYREKPASLNAKEERQFALQLLADVLQEEYDLDTLPVILRGENGKPYFPERPEIHFNYSHTKEYVACGISEEEIGVDIEMVREVKENLIRRVCHEEETFFVMEGEDEDMSERMIMLWTMKEAYLKEKGTGIRESLKNINLAPLLNHDGNGEYQGKYMGVARIGNAYLSYYSSKINDILHI